MKRMLFQRLFLFKQPKVYLGFFLFLIFSTTLYSQVDYSSFVRKATLVTNTKLLVKDGDQTDSTAAKYFKRASLVKLKYMEDRNTESPYYGTWTYQVAYKIMNALDTTQYQNDTLKIAYGPLPLDCKFLQTNEYTNNWKAVQLRVLNICATSGASGNCLQTPKSYPFLPEDIELELTLRSTQISTMGNTNASIAKINQGTASSLGIQSQANISVECDTKQPYISWQIVPTAVEYEVEWVYIPDDLYYPTASAYFNTYATSITQYQLAFNLAEPVRATTKNNYYPMPVEYPSSGKLYYRVRPVGKLINTALQDYDQPAFYSWGFAVAINKVAITFPEDKNWQRVTTFAEEGKFKKVISYYDGLYRSRQSLTHMSSDNNTIIAETIYDHEGRGAVQMLPYPEPCTDLTYKPGRRKDINGNDWNKYDFELSANSTNNDNKKLQTTIGSSKYYSAANPFINPALVYEQDLFTPDAELFPFTQVEYMMDGTGRVSRTSGVGPNHLLGTDHETKYFYSTPLQQELTRLFGSNIGQENHYKKNYVIDANGQVSTSYMDQEGRVIASALVGNSPNSLIELESASVETLTVDLSDKNQILGGGNESVLGFKQFNAIPGSLYTFSYKIPYEYFLLSTGDICLGCKYKLDIRIEGPGLNIKRTKNISPPSIPVNCTADGTTSNWDTTITFPEIGDYYIYKNLVWDGDLALADIEENIIANSGDVLANLQAEYLSQIDSNDCDPFLQNDGHTYNGNAFSAISDAECQGMLHQMINQVSPGGFYFEDINTGTSGYQLRPMTYDSNGDPLTDDLVDLMRTPGLYNSTVTDLFDGTIHYTFIFDLSGGGDLFPSGFSSLSDDAILNAIASNWRFEWGEMMARFLHPEKCHFDECMRYSKPNPTAVDETTSSLIYDLKMSQEIAISPQYPTLGHAYLNPQGNGNIDPFIHNPFSPSQTYPSTTSQTDPWPNNFYSGQVGNLQSNFIAHYITNFGQTYSVWEYSHPSGLYGTTPSITINGGANGQQGNPLLFSAPFDLTATDAQSTLWNIYRGSYLQAKTNFRNDPTRLANIGCPILNIPEKVVGGNPTLPSDQAGIETDANNILGQLNTTPDNLGSLLGGGSQGDMCYESCENKADLLLNNILNPCLSLYEVEEWLSFQDETVNPTLDVITDMNAFRLDIINYCMATCTPPLGYAVITQAELANMDVSTNTYLHDAYVQLGNLQTALAATSYFPNCSTCVGCTSLTDVIHIEDAGDANNTLSMQTGESCVNVSCISITDLNDPNFNVTTFLNNILTGSSPFTLPSPPVNAACSYCGCLPEPTIIDGKAQGSFDYYPSSACIALSEGCTNTNAIDCSSLYNTGASNTDDPTYTVSGNQRYWLFPQNATDCIGNCNIKFYVVNPAGTIPNNLAGELPVSVISSLSNFSSWLQTGPATFLAYADFSLNSPYDVLDYQNYYGVDSASFTKLGIVINLTGCATELVCTPETLYTEDGTQTFNYHDWQSDCIAQLTEIALSNAQAEYEAWVEQQATNALNAFKAACIKPGIETFTMQYQIKEHHYTLYYYDQADNLVQTIPPVGVHPVATSHFVLNNTTHHVVWDGTEPAHTLPTVYQYNSLNQPIEQTTPDGGLSLFYYDDKGRITHSQNERQRFDEIINVGSGTTTVIAPYSRTLYDELGRIKQVSERTITFTGNTNLEYDHFPMAEGSPYHAGSGNNTEQNNVAACSCYVDKQITRTYYEIGNVIASMQFVAENTRSRVAYTTFQEFDGVAYDVGTHYSYDIHGNVKTMVTELNHLIHFGNNRYKRTDYKYDLVSGKVNQVQYQPGRTDKFIHKYSYDADNRLTRVETSPDYTFYETDAKYFYYAHGPLSRMEVGERKVQGVDYAYTIHGWLKGVNAGFLNEQYDMGRDGYASSGSNPNRFIAWDAFGYVLDYYNGDYKAAGASAANYKEFRAAMPGGSTGIFEGTYNHTAGLFNGNIVRMHTALSSHNYLVSHPEHDPNKKWSVNGSVFFYDQLNRIKKSTVWEAAGIETTQTYGSTIASAKYGTEYTYDANGNIKTLKRNGNIPVSGSSYLMDDFTYHYGNGNNQLTQVNDAVTSTGPGTPDPFFGYDYNNDMENQTASNNYLYDKIGNLKTDTKEGVQEIKWSVYGKVREVIFTPHDKPNLEFVYDASGQRVMKIVKTKNTDGSLKAAADWKYTVYSRDAQGNIMSIYTIKKNASNILQMNQDEVPIYGSSRLGVFNAHRKIITASCAPVPQYSITNATPITTCQAESQAIPASPHLIGTSGGNPNAQYVYYNANINTFMITDYQIGVITSGENLNITTVSINGVPVHKIKAVPVIGNKQYEFTDHLGNVLVTLNDVKKGMDGDNNGTVDHYEAHIQTTTDYYPFGMPMPGRYSTAQTCSTTTTTATITPISHDFTGIPGQPLDLTTTQLNLSGYPTYKYFELSSSTDAKIVSTGGSHLEFTKTNSSNTVGVGLRFAVVYGKQYTLKFDASKACSGNTKLQFKIINTSNAAIVYTSGQIALTSTLQTFTFTNLFTADITGDYIIQFYQSGANASCTFSLDNIIFTYPDQVNTTTCINGDSYAWGYNGKLKDNDFNGEGNMYDYGFRIYDPRICKFLSIDPLFYGYPHYTPYQFAGNIPIACDDIDGMENRVRIFYEADGGMEVQTVDYKATGVLGNGILIASVHKSGMVYWQMQDNDGNMIKSGSFNNADGDVTLSKLETWLFPEDKNNSVVKEKSAQSVKGTTGTTLEKIVEEKAIPNTQLVDVVDNPEIAATLDKNGKGSGIKGGFFGKVRGGGKWHGGYDIKADPGTKVYALFGGTVHFVRGTIAPGTEGGSAIGNQVTIKTVLPDGKVIYIVYGHLNTPLVKFGEIVTQKQNIGLSGATGNAYNVMVPHVHVTVSTNPDTRVKKDQLDPGDFMKTKFGKNGKPISAPQ